MKVVLALAAIAGALGLSGYLGWKRMTRYADGPLTWTEYVEGMKKLPEPKKERAA